MEIKELDILRYIEDISKAKADIVNLEKRLIEIKDELYSDIDNVAEQYRGYFKTIDKLNKEMFEIKNEINNILEKIMDIMKKIENIADNGCNKHLHIEEKITNMNERITIVDKWTLRKYITRNPGKFLLVLVITTIMITLLSTGSIKLIDIIKKIIPFNM